MFEKPETFEGLDLDALRALSAAALADAQAIMATDDAELTDEQIEAELNRIMDLGFRLDDGYKTTKARPVRRRRPAGN